MNKIEFSLLIEDIAESHEIKTKEDLENLADDLHNWLEQGLQDYADDYNIEDYEPSY